MFLAFGSPRIKNKLLGTNVGNKQLLISYADFVGHCLYLFRLVVVLMYDIY